MPAPRTLVGRLTAGVALVAVLAFLSQALVLRLWLSPALELLGVETAAHAETVRAALAAAAPAQRAALARRLSTGWMQIGAEAPPPPPPFPPPRDALYEDLQRRLGARAELRLVPADGGRDLVYVGVPVDGATWWIALGGERPRPALYETALFWLAAAAASTAAALLASARWVARPIRQLAGEIARQRAPLRPIDENGRGSDELRSLAVSFNALVRAVEAGRATRQQLLAGLSHDLRTPLARLRLRAETQCEPPVADALAADLGSLEHIVDQFLAYVHGERDQAPGRCAPLAATVDALVRRRTHSGDAIAARVAPLDWPLPELALQRLLDNLIDNALAYGRPPVRVELAEGEAGALLRVLDHGDGMSEAEFDLARQPFVRLSPARGGEGHCGLGLAIVAEIVRQWGGELRLARAGGASGVEATIPRPGSP